MDKVQANEIVDERLIKDLTDWVLLVENEEGLYELSQIVRAMAAEENEKRESIFPPDDIIFSFDHGDDDFPYTNNTGVDSYQKYVRVDEDNWKVLEVIEDHRTAVWVKRNIERFIRPLSAVIRLHSNNIQEIMGVLHDLGLSNEATTEFERLLIQHSPIDEDLTWVNESSAPQTFTRTKIVDTILDWMDDQIVANATPAMLFRTLTVLLETIHNYSVNYHQFNSINFWYIRTSDTTLEVSYEVADEKFSYVLPTNYESDDYASRKRYEMLVNLMHKDFINTAAPLIAHKMYILILDLCKLGESPTNEILEFFAKRFNRNIPLAFTKLEFDAIRYKEDVSWLKESATSQELIAWMIGLNKRRIQK